MVTVGCRTGLAIRHLLFPATDNRALCERILNELLGPFWVGTGQKRTFVANQTDLSETA